MGGFARAIGDAAGKVVSDVIVPGMERAGEHLDEAKVNFRAVEHVFDRTDEGKIAKDLINNKFFPVAGATTETLNKTAIKNFHDPAHPDYLKKVDIGKNISAGKKAGRYAAGRPDDARFINLVQSVEKRHGISEAQNLSNALAFTLKDYVDPLAKNEGERAEIKTKFRQRGSEPYSPLKRRILKAGVPLTDTTPSYTPPIKAERALTGVMYQTLSPLMVVSHLGSVFNGMLGSEPRIFISSLAKTVFPVLADKMPDDEKLLITGAFHADTIRELKYLNTFEAQGRNAILGSTTVRHIYDVLHLPGMSKLMKFRLTLDSNIGKATVEDAAKRYVDIVKKNGPDATRRWALGRNYRWTLRQAGLNPDAILEQGGKLTDRDYKTAIYKFVNDHDFLHKPMNRSMFLQATPTGRMLGTYHSFVTNQGKLMSRAMFRDWSNRGATSVVRNLVIGGIIMPMMGEAINIFQESYRGQPAGDLLQRDIDNLQGNNGVKGYAQTYFDGISHFGGFGIYGHIIRGGVTHSLLQSASGPLWSAIANLAQDTASAGNKVGDKVLEGDIGDVENKDVAPLERDIMYDVPGLSILAQFLAHRMLPNSKDNPEADPLNMLIEHMQAPEQEEHSQDKSNTQSNTKENQNGRSKRNNEFKQSSQ